MILDKEPYVDNQSGSDSSTYGSIKWKKVNDLVCVTIMPTSIVTTEWRSLGTLPVGLRPSVFVYQTAWVSPSNGNYTQVLIRQADDENGGAVTVQGNILAGTTVTFTV